MTMGRLPVGFAGIAGRQTPTHGGGASGKESEDSMAIAILTENLAVHQSIPASGPMSPRPRTAEPSVMTAQRLCRRVRS